MVCAAPPLKLIVPVPPASVPPLPKFPPTFTVLAPVEVNRALLEVPAKLMLPVVVMVPLLTVIRATLLLLRPLIVMEAAVSVPAPTLKVDVTLLDDGAVMVIAPLTFNVKPLRVMPFAAVAALIVMPAAAAFAVKVTVWVELTVTVSVAPGTPPLQLLQVAGALQLPVAAELQAAASADDAGKTDNSMTSIHPAWRNTAGGVRRQARQRNRDGLASASCVWGGLLSLSRPATICNELNKLKQTLFLQTIMLCIFYSLGCTAFSNQ